MEDIENKVEETQGVSEDMHPVEKVPDFVLLKLSRQEVGALQSYIEELEDKLTKYSDYEGKDIQSHIDELEYKVATLEGEKKEKERLTHEDNKEFKKEKFYKELAEKIKERDLIIRDLKKTNDRLLYNNLRNCRECILSKKSNINT